MKISLFNTAYFYHRVTAGGVSYSNIFNFTNEIQQFMQTSSCMYI